MFTHGYLPEYMIGSIITPLVKNKKWHLLSDKDNKLFEKILFTRRKELFWT